MRNKKTPLLLTIVLFSTILMVIPLAQASTTTLEPIDDAEVNDGDPNENQGASDYLHVGYQIFSGYAKTYIKFNLPVTNKKVISATVKTYWYSIMVDTWLSFVACLVSNSWSEQTITWNNAPAHGEIIATELITDDDNFDFDVSEYIPDSGEFSICIYEDPPYGDYGLQGDSKEGWLLPDPPILVIVYEQTIGDILPFIIGGVVVGIIGVGAVVGGVIYKKRKKNYKKKQQVPILDPKQNPYRMRQKPLYCQECGTEILKAGIFCSKCGSKINN